MSTRKAEATEIAFVPLIPNSNVDDDDSDASQVMQASITTLTGQEGFVAAYYGRYIEREDMLQLVVDWTSLQAHETFMKSGSYQPFIKHLKTISSGDPHLYHVHFTTPFSLPSSAPVTELVTLYFESSYNNADFEDNWKKFADAAKENAEGIQSLAAGWSIDEVEHKSLEGKKGKAFVAAIGWSSVKAHMDYRETQPFKDSVGYLRDGPKGIEMHHVTFKGYRDYS